MSEKKVIILVAADNSDDREKLTISLRTENFQVLATENRDLVVTLARSELPSLVLLDFKSCFDTCRMLKRNFVTEPIPVIAILSPAEEADRVAILELGADDCIAKPYNFRELTLRIKASLRRTQDKQGKTRYKQSQFYSALARPSVRPKSKRGT